MKRVSFFMLLVLPLAAWAAGPFDGTWKADMSTAVYSGKPDGYSITNDQFTCTSCAPAFTVPADTKLHKVPGHPYYDQVSATVVSASIVKASVFLKGKKVRDSTFTVAADGKSMTQEDVNFEGSSSSTVKTRYNRVKTAASAAHVLSGAWMADATTTTPIVLIYQQTEDGLKFKDPDSPVSYDAKFDGREYPLTSDEAGTTITLQKLGPRKFQSTHKVKGKVVSVFTMEVTADGRTMHAVAEDLIAEQTLKFDARKQ